MRWIIFVLLCLAVPFTGTNGNGTAAAEDHEETLQSLLAQAGAEQSRGNFAAAAESYRKATGLSPLIPELWANLGLMDHELGNSREAIESFRRAIRLNPSLFVPQLFLGIEYIKSRDAGDAISYLQNAQRLNPKDLETALSLGSAYAMLGKADRAADMYLTAIDIAPRNGNAWLGLGTAYLQQVENDARLMTSTYGRSSYASLRAAESLAQEGALPQAENAYKAALSSPPVLPCTHAEFGIVLLDLKKIDEAREQFGLESKARSHCGLEAIGLAIADVADGHTDAGLKELVSAATTDTDFVGSNLSRFRSAVTADQARQLVAMARAQHDGGALKAGMVSLLDDTLGPEASGAVSHLDENEASFNPRPSDFASAERFYEAGNYTQCDQALKPRFRNLSASEQLLVATCSFYTGDFRTTSAIAARLRTNPKMTVQGLYWESKADERLAVAALTHAGEFEPDSPRMHVLIGDAFRQKRHWTEAETEYRKAIDLDPKSRAARLSLAIVLFSELKTDEAFALDNSLLEEMPSDPEANLLAAEILAEKHEFQQAEPFLSGCNNLNVDLVPRCHVLLGQVYAATDRVSAAIAQYKLGLASDQDGSIHYQLARLYQRTGDKNQAAEEMRLSKQIRERWDQQAHIDLGQSALGIMSQ